MLALDIKSELWRLKAPFRITGYVFENADVLVATVSDGDARGRGEANGVYYHDEDIASMTRQIEQHRGELENGIDRESLREALPPGGARNALDCALWDLEAKRTHTPVWKLAGILEPKPLVTTFTVGAGTPDEMAASASAYKGAKALKLKLTADDPAACVKAVRAARPDAWIGVDANQGFTRSTLEALIPALRDAGVKLIEQPLPIGADAELDGLRSSIPIAADESVQCAADIEAAAGRYDVINIKLDKCGGLTEAFAMIRAARARGLMTMVGCMSGTSLAMAPGFLLGQLCDFVDLDAPVFLAGDRDPAARYANGQIYCPESVWGGAG